jgi:alcohol dehydrogenase class IV
VSRPFTIARLPRIQFGAGVVQDLPATVSRHGQRLFLVTGEHSFAEARLTFLTHGLTTERVSVLHHVRVASEPGPDTIDALVAAARRIDADVVMGIGGGSVLDVAKAVAGLCHSGTSVMDHIEGVGRGIPYVGPSIPLVAVPTTAGTGSEVTRNAVVTLRGPQGFKRSFRDDRLIAADAVVDPDLLAGASRQLIATNGLDALTQLLEAWTSTAANAMTDALALDGLHAIRAGLLLWYADPAGPEAGAARTDMAYAALLSGICLANAGLGAVHGLAAPIGALLPIAHGAACGAILAATVRTNIAAMSSRDPDAIGLWRYAKAGRLLAGLDDQSSDPMPARHSSTSWPRGPRPSARPSSASSALVDRISPPSWQASAPIRCGPTRSHSHPPSWARSCSTDQADPVAARQRDGPQRVRGKPRSTELVPGSGQREVTTLPRV